MNGVSFTVHGNPTPKGSYTHMPNGAMLPAGTTNSRKRMADWRADIKHVATDAMGTELPTRDPIRLTVEFALPYPQSSVRKYQLGWLPCTKKPDVDKLLRALMDGLTGIVWVDDSQVIACTVNKVYAWSGQPGAAVTCDFLSEDFCRRWGQSRALLIEAMTRNGVDA